jgi:hypothetical protein
MLFLFAFATWSGVVSAQSPCTSCTISITANNSGSYSLGAGQTLCISNGATFSGTVSSISSTSKICITGNGKFTGSINNIPAGAQIYVAAGSQYTPSGLNSIGGTLTNLGTTAFSTYLNVDAAFTISNSGTITFNSGLSLNTTTAITNSGTITCTSGYQCNTGASTSINNSGNFYFQGYTRLYAGSAITNTGTFSATGQQDYTGVTLTNTSGLLEFANTYNIVGGSSTISNSGSLILNGFVLSASGFTNTSTGSVSFQNTFTLANGCSYNNQGTTNFTNNFQLDLGSTFSNNGDVLMNNGNTYLNTNGTFNNNGFIYVNGRVTFSNNSTVTNNCTIIAMNGFTNQSGNTKNYGYLIVPSDAVASTSAIIFEASFLNGTNAWVQGINFTHNGGTVSGSGNFYFTGTTINYDPFGNGSTPPINFFDTTPTYDNPSRPGNGIFDEGWGTISNTVRTSISPLDITARPTTCVASVINQAVNSECPISSTPLALVKNGTFTTAITNTTGDTYSSGTGTVYNFSGGSFWSQADYRGTSASVCARSNMAQGNAFAIVNLGAASSYTGSGNCSNASQAKFPGDAAYSIASSAYFMYMAGNTLNGTEYLVYQQNLTGLTIGQSYTLYFYVSSMREPANAGVDPIIRLRLGGSDGLPDGTICYGPYVVTETATQNSAALSGWKRVSYNFVATATTLKFKITDAAFSSSGDEWALTALGIVRCDFADTDGDGIRDDTDIDDDNDGVLDTVESGGFNPLGDADGDGRLNYKDATPGTGMPAWTDTNNDGVNDYYDSDLDGVINAFDLDSDNDGIADVIENGGVDTNGDGKIDCTTDANADGLRDCVATTGLTLRDLDGDGFANQFDLDSDNDGIPDIREVLGTDSNNDGKADSFTDSNTNGLHDSFENAGSLLTSGADTNNDGRADSWPNKNQDKTGPPNPYDLDSDGDGITDAVEAGFANTVSITNGMVTGAATNGWANSVRNLGASTLALVNTDSHGNPNYLDIDSDNDGITDNVEGMATTSYIIPTDTDSDADGLADVYEPGREALYGGGGITPFDKDGDGTPDYRDSDTDNDGVPDFIEGYGPAMYNVLYASLNFTDTDGDGLVDTFDNLDLGTLTTGNFFKNVAMDRMGSSGNFNGPSPSGSKAKLPQNTWATSTDRDFRNVYILPVTITAFTATYKQGSTLLQWQTTSETNLSNYVVLRSTNGVQFTAVAQQQPLNASTASYRATDDVSGITAPTVYYKLAAHSQDGSVQYSPVVTVQLPALTGVKAYPNPFTTQLSVSVQQATHGMLTLHLINAAGITLRQQSFQVSPGSNRLLLQQLGSLPAGPYTLVVYNGSQVLHRLTVHK